MSVDTICVGQVWASHQRSHPGWEVEVRKVGSSHVQADVLRPPQVRGRKVNYSLTAFVRDFDYIRGGKGVEAVLAAMDTKEEDKKLLNGELRVAGHGRTYTHVTPTHVGASTRVDNEQPLPVEDTRLCTTCFVVKPLEEFSFAPSTQGGFTDKRLKTCSVCVSKKRVTGTKAYHARLREEKAAEQAFVATATVKPQRVATPKDQLAVLAEFIESQVPSAESLLASMSVQSSATALLATRPDARQLASELVELAARVEALGAPAGLAELVTAVHGILDAGTTAAGVFVVPMPAVRALREAVKGLDK